MNREYLILFSNLFITAYIIRTVRNTFYPVFLWQIKEYRLDRILAHLKTLQGKKLIFGWLSLIKWLILINYLLLYFYPLRVLNEPIGLLFFIIIPIIYYFEGIWNLLELYRRGWRIPKWTPKTVIIVITGFLFVFLTVLSSRQVDGSDDLMFAPFIIADKLLPIAIIVIVIVLNIPSLLYRKWITWKAKKKIAEFTDLIVIGITGSYGKTSTKEFLASILATKFNVLATEGSINTEIGVAKTVLRLTDEHEIFIVEMGAYKKGEIAAICEIVQPKMGIITGINEQHIELFGSIENTIKTKFELVKSLQKNGVAIFNAANRYVQKMISWCGSQRPDLSIWRYQRVANKKFIDNALSAYDTKAYTDKLSFRLLYHGQELPFETKLLGIQQVDNILAAACASLILGLSHREIQKAVSRLNAPTKTMRLVGKYKKAILIDDTYNANPDGVLAALEYMRIINGIKILVLTPLIELGTDADSIHELLGKKAAEVCDLILLTNLNYIDSFTKGASLVEKGGEKIQIVNSIVGERIIKQHIQKGGAVVFEGKESGKILERFLLPKSS